MDPLQPLEYLRVKHYHPAVHRRISNRPHGTLDGRGNRRGSMHPHGPECFSLLHDCVVCGMTVLAKTDQVSHVLPLVAQIPVGTVMDVQIALAVTDGATKIRRCLYP
jgi:hypothetical protein